MAGTLGDLLPGIKYGNRVHPHEMLNGGYGPMVKRDGEYLFVDGDVSASGGGRSWKEAFKTIQEAIDASTAGDVIYIGERKHTDYTGDPVSYEENLVIPYTSSSLSLIGVGRGKTQGGLPQLKDGTTTTDPILKVRAPGCLITGLGFNGAGCTGGGILFDDDYSTKAAFGTIITGNHFKNCKGPDVDDAKEGGAIQWSTAGNAWQVNITDNHFYKNVADITLMGTTNTRPQDVVIDGNRFSGNGVSTDCNIYCGGSGFGSVTIDRNVFGILPSLGSNVNRYMDLTGTLVGMVTRNFFGCLSAEGESEVTFQADGTAAKIPTTVFMAGNFGQFSTGVGAGLVSGEVFA